MRRTLRSVLLIASLFLCVPLWTQAASLKVGDFSLVSSKRISRTVFEYVYKASVTNTGEDVINVTTILNSTAPTITVPQGYLGFGAVAAGAKVKSIGTITLRHDRTAPFDLAALAWNISSQPAVAIRAKFDVVPATGDAPLRVTFSPSVITTSAIDSYEWDLDGNGTFETRDTVGRNQTYNYIAPGTYQPALRVTDSQNRQDTQTVSITVTNAPPVVTAQAQLSNGQVPLAVAFTATATDNEGIATCEWDFDGDGVYDYTSATSGNITHVYDTVGTFYPKLRVTDNLGAATVYSVPATEVRAAPAGSPSVTLTVSTATGLAPLAVNFSSNTSDPQGKTFTTWEWDFDGDGVYDSTTTSSATSYSYSAAGTFFPRLRVTTSDGRTAEDVEQVTVKQSVSLSLSTDTIDTAVNGTSTVATTLGAKTKVSLGIEKRGGGVVRTLVQPAVRGAGTYSDDWDGKDDSGSFMAEGDYYAVLWYELNGVMQRYDLALTTGGVQYNPSRSYIANSFSPFANSPMVTDITLTKASEVDAFIGGYNVNTRYVTLLQRVPLGKGTHRVTWNGDNGDGKLILPSPWDSFLFGVWGYYLPDNAIYVRSGAHISGLTVTPSIFDPTGAEIDGSPCRSVSTFTLSKAAAVELVITDVNKGVEVARFQYPGIPAGAAATISWDGKDQNGMLIAPGSYRLGITAIDASGYKSLIVYGLQRIYY